MNTTPKKRTSAQLRRASWHSLFDPLRSGLSDSPRSGAPPLFTTSTPRAIDFAAVHRISDNVFRVRRHTLHVEALSQGSAQPVFEIFDLTEGTGPFRIRAGSLTMKPPAFVGRKNAWAAQAFAISQGFFSKKGGTR